MTEENEEPQEDEALEKLLSQATSEEFTPFFETRVMAHVADASRSSSFIGLEDMGPLFQQAFRRVTMPACVACLVVASVNVQASGFEVSAVSSELVEAVFSIPPETLDQAAEL